METDFNKNDLLERLNDGDELLHDEVEFLNSEFKKEILNVLQKYKAELSFDTEEGTDDIIIKTEIDFYPPRDFVRDNFLYRKNLGPKSIKI